MIFWLLGPAHRQGPVVLLAAWNSPLAVLVALYHLIGREAIHLGDMPAPPSFLDEPIARERSERKVETVGILLFNTGEWLLGCERLQNRATHLAERTFKLCLLRILGATRVDAHTTALQVCPVVHQSAIPSPRPPLRQYLLQNRSNFS